MLPSIVKWRKDSPRTTSATVARLGSGGGEAAAERRHEAGSEAGTERLRRVSASAVCASRSRWQKCEQGGGGTCEGPGRIDIKHMYI